MALLHRVYFQTVSVFWLNWQNFKTKVVDFKNKDMSTPRWKWKIELRFCEKDLLLLKANWEVRILLIVTNFKFKGKIFLSEFL